ncbi:MAG: hypothetical protein AAFS03_02010 [Pseudomonadota bacterium]
MRRFLPGEAETAEGGRRKRQREAFENELLRLLSDPAYNAKYQVVADAVADAMTATERTLAQLDGLIAAAEDEIDQIQDKAARLPDGTRVYRDANGVLRREDGSVVEDHLADTIIWRGDQPSYEHYVAARRQHETLVAARREVTDYQNDVLGPARDRLSDEEDPPSLDELEEILDRIETEMPAAVADNMPGAKNEAPEADRSKSVALPTLATKP